MNISKHKECDICGKVVGTNCAYTTIRMKNYLVGFAGACKDNRKIHICENCISTLKQMIKDTK